ncbi:MAG TPA: TlpA disulfide reductase family protein [Polyangiaceae bacterium]|nr:TlpA disulfide reductase family protein [Polyangiaceae bacterium]
MKPLISGWVLLCFVVLSSCREPAASQTRAGRRPASVGTSSSSSLPVTATEAAQAAATPGAVQNASDRGRTQLSAIRADQLLATIRGFGAKATLVNAWASWCGPCRDELPMLESLAQNLSRDDVRLVLVSVDEAEDGAKAEAFLRSVGNRSPAYLAAPPLSEFKVGMNPRWPGMIPATFLFDAAGKLRYFWGGPVYEHEITQVIEGLLAGKLIDGQSDFTLAPGKTEAGH